MAGFSSYTGSLTIAFSDSPAGPATASSLPFGTIVNPTNITSKTAYSVGSSTGQVNEVASSILTISSSGAGTLNLQALTDLLGKTSVALVRLKRYGFWLLSPNDDPTVGTSCSSVIVGAATTNTHNLNMGGTLPTFTLYGNPSGTGDKQVWADASSAGVPVSATTCNVLITNEDGSHGAAVFYNAAGSTN